MNNALKDTLPNLKMSLNSLCIRMLKLMKLMTFKNQMSF